jgi:hypothetical protein
MRSTKIAGRERVVLRPSPFSCTLVGWHLAVTRRIDSFGCSLGTVVVYKTNFQARYHWLRFSLELQLG